MTDGNAGKYPFKKLSARDLDYLWLYYKVADGKPFEMAALSAIGRDQFSRGRFGASDGGAMTRAIKAGFVAKNGEMRSLTEAGLWRAQRLHFQLRRKGFATVEEMHAAGALDLADYELENDGKPLNLHTLNMIGEDLNDAAKEGTPKGAVITRLHRVTRLAEKFVARRTDEGSLNCDVCSFNPKEKAKGTTISPRSLIDVHHRIPLAAGTRETKTADTDFVLLCPTCHRFEHAKINAARKKKPAETPGEMAKRIMKIADHFSSLPVLDNRTDDEILGYDERGLPI